MPKIHLTPSYHDAMRLNRLRKRAKRHGLKLSRSRWHQPYVHNLGGLALLDDNNNVVAGDGYSLSLNNAEKVLSMLSGQQLCQRLQQAS
jgi:hypothetical protein